MSDETFSRRWLLLSVIGMLTSFLLTIGVAAFGFRGVASADQRPAKPTVNTDARASSGTFLVREIGGSQVRTPTATSGTAPTIRETDEPLRLTQRFIQDTGGAGQPAVDEPMPEPEPTSPPAPPVSAPSRPVFQPEPPARMTSPPNPVNSGPSPTRVPEPPVNRIIEPVATSTPVPHLGGTVTTSSYAAVSTPESAKPAATTESTATARATATATPQPPTVTIEISDSRIEAGDSVTVTVYARADQGLDWIDWEGVDTGERALDRESRYDCDGKTTCVQSWTVSVSRLGTHTLQARARDTKGNKSGIATTELRVRAAPTAAPTKVPLLTAIPTSNVRR